MKIYFKILICYILISFTGCNNTNIDRETLSKALLKYDKFEGLQHGLILVTESGKWGVINTNGKDIIPCKYDYINSGMTYLDGEWQEGFIFDDIIIAKLNGSYGAMDKSGKEIISFKYESLDRGEDGILIASQNGKSGYINKDGKVIVECKYDNAKPFQGGIGLVEINERNLLVDKSGKEFEIKNDYNKILAFSEGMAAVSMSILNQYGHSVGKWGFINTKGEEVIPCKYDIAYLESGGDYMCSFKDGLAFVSQNDKWGFIDNKGDIVVPFRYDNYFSEESQFTEGLASVAIKSGDGWSWGYVDKTGKEVIPCKYESAYPFIDGVAVVEKDGKLGVINKNGKERIPCEYYKYRISEDYDIPVCFSNGLLKLRVNDNNYGGNVEDNGGKCGYIDKSGKVIIPFIYDYIGNFSDGLVAVQIGDKWGAIDKSGKEIIPCVFDYEFYFDNGLAFVRLDGENGYVDKDGYFIGKGYVKNINTNETIGTNTTSNTETLNLIGTYKRSVTLNANYDGGEETVEIIDDRNSIIHFGRYGYYEGQYRINGNIIEFDMDGSFGKRIYKFVYDKKEKSLTLEDDHAGDGAYYKESKSMSSRDNSNYPNTSTDPTDDYNRNQTKPVTINSEIDFRSYINNKTFRSLSDNITFKYKNSENTVYIGNTAAGTLQVIDYLTTEDGTVVTFLVRSPYRNNPIRYSFATPDILFDEEGREYKMR